MNKNSIFHCWLLFLLVNNIIQTEQFIYPVAKMDKNNILLIYQKSLDDIELLIWDNENNIATRALTSLFLPSQVHVLPNKQEISFIDRGRIRIKHIKKRSPRTLSIQEPISSILSMDWLDNYQFYFVGKNKQSYGVFLCSFDEHNATEVYTLAHNFDIDYLYPCKKNQQLCAIKRNKQNEEYQVIIKDWNPVDYGQRTMDQEMVLYKAQNPICFLQQSSNNLFFTECDLSYPASQTVHFYYHMIDNTGQNTILFEYYLPAKFIMGNSESRAYESIYPFLPELDESSHSIYFTSYDPIDDMCHGFIYSLETKAITSLQHRGFEQNSYMSAKTFDKNIYFGLVLQDTTTRSLLHMDQITGLLKIKLPKYP